MDVEQRARFEEWITKVYPDRDLEKWPNGKYAYSFAALAWEVWQAALTPPEGFVLVPVESTEEMQIAVEKANPWLIRYEVPEIWAAMLAARPEMKL